MPEDARSRARILAFVGGALAVAGMIWGSVIGFYGSSYLGVGSQS